MKNLLLAAVVACLAVPAWAQQKCVPHELVEQDLNGKHGETRHVMGIMSNGMLLEFWGNVDTGSWTIIVTSPEGISCNVADGVAFQPVTEALPNTDDPA